MADVEVRPDCLVMNAGDAPVKKQQVDSKQPDIGW